MSTSPIAGTTAIHAHAPLSAATTERSEKPGAPDIDSDSDNRAAKAPTVARTPGTLNVKA